jgi:MOSC domain-containing protein YiiM
MANAVMIPEGLRALMTAFPHSGSVVWIGVRPAPGAPMLELSQVEAIVGRGLKGDRTAEKSRPGNSRQVTLIQAEHLAVVGAVLRRAAINPAVLRRNIVVAGLSLASLKGHQFRIGDALLEWSGECAPCSKLDAALGEGGYNAMRGHGGITARVLESGVIDVGTAVTAKPLMQDPKTK